MRGLFKDRGIKRVYILGAGFSAPLGMPITNKLLKLTYDIARTKEWYSDFKPCPKGQAEWLLQKLQFYFPLEGFSHKKIQNEEFSKEFDIEKFLSYALAASAFGENFSNGDDQFVSFLKGWIGEAIWRQQLGCMTNYENIPVQYFHFVKSLDQSLIFTFNWDTVVETLLDKSSMSYDFGLESARQKSGTPIMKLHGSIDWFFKPWVKDEKVKTEIIRRHDQPADLSEGEKIYRVTQNLSYFYESISTLNYPLLVIPAYDKISQVQKLGNMWEYLWSFLQDDLEVIIIGFSWRPDDYHSRAILYSQLVHGSKEGHLKVKVVARAGDEKRKEEIKAIYKGVHDCRFWFDGFNEHVFERFINN